MTDLTRVIACKSRVQAAKQAGILRGSGHNVVVVHGTDAVELIDGKGAKLTWESGEDIDWLLVIGSLKPIVLEP